MIFWDDQNPGQVAVRKGDQGPSRLRWLRTCRVDKDRYPTLHKHVEKLSCIAKEPSRILLLRHDAQEVRPKDEDVQYVRENDIISNRGDSENSRSYDLTIVEI